MQRIDAHQHFWRLDRGDYAWLDAGGAELDALRRDFLPADLAPLRRAHGVVASVAVQAAASSAETRYLLALASADPDIAAVVGWVDLADPGAAGTIRALAVHPRLRGLRPMLQDLADPTWITHGPRADALAAVRELGLSLDALVRTEHLPALLQFVQAQPDIPVVIDHAAKPPLGSEAAMAQWARSMRQLAGHSQVLCKLSGLLTEMPVDAAVEPMLQRIWHFLLESFGPGRLMWGSDWPVLELAGPYGQWVLHSQTLIGELSPSEQSQVWQGNAARFYQLELTQP